MRILRSSDGIIRSSDGIMDLICGFCVVLVVLRGLDEDEGSAGVWSLRWDRNSRIGDVSGSMGM